MGGVWFKRSTHQIILALDLTILRLNGILIVGFFFFFFGSNLMVNEGSMSVKLGLMFDHVMTILSYGLHYQR